MKLKSTLLGLALSVSGATAFAADPMISWNEDFSVGHFGGNYSQGATVDDRFGFTVFSPSFVTASLITSSLDTFSNLDFTSVSLTGDGSSTNFTGLDLSSTTLEGSSVEGWALGRTRLDPGTYFLTLAGSATGTNGGSFGGAINVSPVPEPETYALMLAGLGVVGFLARRRQKS